MKQVYRDEGDFKVIAVKDENEKFSHFRVVDRNEELLSNNKFETAYRAINWGHNFMCAEGLIK